MKLKYILLTVALALPFAASAADHRNAIDELCTEDVNFAEQQYSLMLDKVGRTGRVVNPKTIDKMSRLVTIPIDDWCDITYDYETDKENRELKPQSYRFKALANLVNFLAANVNDANPGDINMKTLKCDVLRQFTNSVRSHAQADAAKTKRITVADLTYNWRTQKPSEAMRTWWL